VDGLDRLVAAVRRAGLERWPELRVEDADLRAHLEPLALEGEPPHPADLYLVAGCLAGRADAMAQFEATQMPVVERTVRAAGGAADVVDEVKQQVRTAALVHRGERRSFLAGYRGDGPLGSWVRVVALREAMRCLRALRRERAASDDEIFALIAAQPDPEVAVIQASTRAELKAAFRAALARLPRRERTALRLSVLDGLSIDAIGAMYRVHRATAARWVARAREQLVRDTRAAVSARLAVDRGEVDSILRLIGSRLDISIATSLGRESG